MIEYNIFLVGKIQVKKAILRYHKFKIIPAKQLSHIVYRVAYQNNLLIVGGYQEKYSVISIDFHWLLS